jgi:hypothetical protein
LLNYYFKNTSACLPTIVSTAIGLSGTDDASQCTDGVDVELVNDRNRLVLIDGNISIGC